MIGPFTEMDAGSAALDLPGVEREDIPPLAPIEEEPMSAPEDEEPDTTRL